MTNSTTIKSTIEKIGSESFSNWYKQREIAQNIRQGKHYFNGPSPVPPSSRHSPSRLLKCHRNVYYQLHNAPSESPEPSGIFWFGTKFETDIALPYLQDLTTDGQYVRNSVWVDFEIESRGEQIQFRGETDPVFVDAESNPLLLTEIKTTSSVDRLEQPKQQHKAQAHTYLHGLSEKYDKEVRDAVIIYVGRNEFSLKAFYVPFDSQFWEDVVIQWAAKNSEYRRTETLPPGMPEREWECSYCSYRDRCGKGDLPYEDCEPEGFLPLFDEYPQDSVEHHLKSNPTVRLTPTLAHCYPEFREISKSHNWHCPVCQATYSVDTVQWDGDTDQPPICPACGKDGIAATMSGPFPETHRINS